MIVPRRVYMDVENFNRIDIDYVAFHVDPEDAEEVAEHLAEVIKMSYMYKYATTSVEYQ